MFCDDAAPKKPSNPGFAIYTDENVVSSKKPTQPKKKTTPFPIFVDPKAGQLSDENAVPSRSLAAAASEVKSDSFEKMPPPAAIPANNPNVTMALPSEEDFAELANKASTPFHGRPFR